MTEPNRFVLIFKGQNVLDVTGVAVDIARQDDGETLKVFVSDLPPDEKAQAISRHRAYFAEALRTVKQ